MTSLAHFPDISSNAQMDEQRPFVCLCRPRSQSAGSFQSPSVSIPNRFLPAKSDTNASTEKAISHQLKAATTEDAIQFFRAACSLDNVIRVPSLAKYDNHNSHAIFFFLQKYIGQEE